MKMENCLVSLKLKKKANKTFTIMIIPQNLNAICKFTKHLLRKPKNKMWQKLLQLFQEVLPSN